MCLFLLSAIICTDDINVPIFFSHDSDSSVSAVGQLYEEDVTLKKYIKQLSRHNNFKWFALMNFVQVRYVIDLL